LAVPAGKILNCKGGQIAIKFFDIVDFLPVNDSFILSVSPNELEPQGKRIILYVNFTGNKITINYFDKYL
jgi:hypothetical protein